VSRASRRLSRRSGLDAEVRFVCAEHASRPGAFAHRRPEEFLGQFVKLAFPVQHPQCRYEHIWTRVTRIVDSNKLEGITDNDSIFALDVPCGSRVVFGVHDIEDVMP
jgi:hypothetical protein